MANGQLLVRCIGLQQVQRLVVISGFPQLPRADPGLDAGPSPGGLDQADWYVLGLLQIVGKQVTDRGKSRYRVFIRDLPPDLLTAFEATLDNGLIVFACLYLVICFCSVGVWAYAGARISGLLRDRSTLQWCNRVMGGLLVVVAIYLLYLQTEAF